MDKFVPGQRWISESEPELGLGTLLSAGVREVKISFHATGEVRTYMHRNAPLRRVRLKQGDRVRSRSGQSFVVTAVSEVEGLLVYRGEAGLAMVSEQDLLDTMTFSDPDKRLMAGQVGKPKDFDLRLRTLMLRRDMLGSRARGLVGARMELLPHQIYIAHRVASRHHPRVLLADEVGLGKTIEAGLVFHRLFVTEQIARVLIVVPEQLVHQWVVEMYRRFNHMFTVMDEGLCRSEEKGDKSANPFQNRQTMVCAIDFLAGSPRRARQAADAGVDLLIVDEAHHLGWTPETAGPEYESIRTLAEVSRGVLLLTATPIQLGVTGHFGRLRLLDPNRFHDLEKYLAEVDLYRELADLVNRILEKNDPDLQAIASLRNYFPLDKALLTRLEAYEREPSKFKGLLIEDLIDRHGTGRIMYRNRRSVMTGFPKRVVNPVALPNTPEHRIFTRAVKAKAAALQSTGDFSRYLNGPVAFRPEELDLAASGLGETPGEAADFLRKAWRRDPRLEWLVGLLKELENEKILLICSHKNVVFALMEILPTLTTATFTSFHENMTIATRDKNAAYFSQPGGAQLLICSEIGSEGRNFQFAHHLALFDLPMNPSVLEQRIGRLDRIGQKNDIHIHVPYSLGTVHEVVFRWYEEGLNAFRRPLLGSDYFFEAQNEEVRQVCLLVMEAEAAGEGTENHFNRLGLNLEKLVLNTQGLVHSVQDALEQGRDRLLEINSNRPAVAAGLIEEIRRSDGDLSLEDYMERVFDHFGVDTTSTAVNRGYFIFPGPHMFVDSFPALPEEGLGVTYDRQEALVREDLAFLSLDHPMVRGAVDMYLSGGDGTVALVNWPDAPLSGIALETVHILEAIAPGLLHVDRFLAPSPIRVLVDQDKKDATHLLDSLDLARPEAAPVSVLETHREILETLLPVLVLEARTKTETRAAGIKAAAWEEARKNLEAERDRLRDLREINPAISIGEVEDATRHLEEILRRIDSAEIRLDAVRLVIMGKSVPQLFDV